MQKDFGHWHEAKAKIDSTPGAALFHEREIWWCTLGVNIGYEQNGGSDFARPVVIVRKFNLDACLVVPLTGRDKTGRYYFPVGTVGDRTAVAVLSQLRFIDRKRLTNKICTLDQDTFCDLVKAIQSASLPYCP